MITLRGNPPTLGAHPPALAGSPRSPCRTPGRASYGPRGGHAQLPYGADGPRLGNPARPGGPGCPRSRCRGMTAGFRTRGGPRPPESRGSATRLRWASFEHALPARGCPRCADGARPWADSRETDPCAPSGVRAYVRWPETGPLAGPRVPHHVTSSRTGSERTSDSQRLVIFFALSGH